MRAQIHEVVNRASKDAHEEKRREEKRPRLRAPEVLGCERCLADSLSGERRIRCCHCGLGRGLSVPRLRRLDAPVAEVGIPVCALAAKAAHCFLRWLALAHAYPLLSPSSPPSSHSLSSPRPPPVLSTHSRLEVLPCSLRFFTPHILSQLHEI